MIEKKRVKCKKCGGSGEVDRLIPLTYHGDEWIKRICLTCDGEGEIIESDRDFIARLQSIIVQQEKSIAAYKRLAKRWMKKAKWLAQTSDLCTVGCVGPGCYACIGPSCYSEPCVAARLKAAKKAVEGEQS